VIPEFDSPLHPTGEGLAGFAVLTEDQPVRDENLAKEVLGPISIHDPELII
jgi:hypothetical protein